MRTTPHRLLRISALLFFLILASCAAPLIKPTEKLTGHLARVMDVTWSPDGKLLASCGFDGSIRTWDTGRKAPLSVLATESPWVLSVVWSPDGKRLVSTTNTAVDIWNPGTGDKVVSLKTGAPVAHGPRNIYAAWSPNGRLLALYGWEDGAIKIINAEDGTQVSAIRHTAMVSSLEWSGDGSTLASAGWDRKLKFWDTKTWAERSSVDIDITEVIKVAWSPDGRRLSWFGYIGHELFLWDVAGAVLERKLSVARGITSVAWSPDGNLIATAGGDGVVRVWEASTGRETKALSHNNRIDRMAWNPGGAFIATVPFGENSAIVWNMKSGSSEPLLGEAGSVTALAWSPDGRLLATGNYDGSVIVWDKF